MESIGNGKDVYTSYSLPNQVQYSFTGLLN